MGDAAVTTGAGTTASSWSGARSSAWPPIPRRARTRKGSWPMRPGCAPRARTWPRTCSAVAGGLSLGLEAAGYRVVLSADHDAEAVETHRHHFGGLGAGLGPE